MKTMQQIIEAEEAARAKWEAETVVHYIGERAYTIADLRTIFEFVQDMDDWKNPVNTDAVPIGGVQEAIAAVEFFHGDRPTVVGVSDDGKFAHLVGRGYQG